MAVSVGWYRVPLSAGEFLDYCAIQEVKHARLQDPVRRQLVQDRVAAIRPMLYRFQACVIGQDKEAWPRVQQLFDQLVQLHKRLWDLEDSVREAGLPVTECDRDHVDELLAELRPFVSCAADIFRLNDCRSRLKKQINELCGAPAESREYQKGQEL